MPVRIYNTLTREKQEFVPLNPPHVHFYNCGPTVYGEFHIGNARNFVVVDVIRRWLIARGYAVKYVQNITDVDDKIINRAKQEGVQPAVITERYTTYFLEKLKQLGNLPADAHPRATAHIGPMISLIKKLVDRGHAYATDDGSVWFEVGTFPEYGRLSRKPLDQMQQGERVDDTMQQRKKSPLDFALWKGVKPGEPSWKSPWGEGRPGWHIECSCMVMKSFNAETIDIHAGGQDLQFPHHENEIAQSEAATGKPFVRYWIHNGMLDIDGEKMSKSLGNFRTLEQIFQHIDPMTLRYFLISARYRDKLDFTEAAVHSCQSAVKRLVTASREARRLLGNSPTAQWQGDEKFDGLWNEFAEAMDDDFNTPRALAALLNTVTLVNTAAREVEAGAAPDALARSFALLMHLRDTLGLGVEMEPADTELDETALVGLRELLSAVGVAPEGLAGANELMPAVIQARTDARKAKNFALSDQIRDRLKDLGIALEDKKEGTVWRKG